MIRTVIAYAVSAVFAGVGIILRLSAESLAWPSGGYSYSGARSDTSWAHTEAAYAQIALVIISVGGLLFVVTFGRWLFQNTHDGKQ